MHRDATSMSWKSKKTEKERKCSCARCSAGTCNCLCSFFLSNGKPAFSTFAPRASETETSGTFDLLGRTSGRLHADDVTAVFRTQTVEVEATSDSSPGTDLYV